jgi:hypothetical protein
LEGRSGELLGIGRRRFELLLEIAHVVVTVKEWSPRFGWTIICPGVCRDGIPVICPHLFGR